MTRTHTLIGSWSLMLLAALVVACTAQSASAITDAEVEELIERLKQHLIDEQDVKTGIIGNEEASHRYGSGETALSLTALSYAGVSQQHPTMVRGVGHLRRTDLDGTYQTGLHCHVYAHMNDDFLPLLEESARALARGANPNTTFPYSIKVKEGSSRNKNGSFDISNTQYGLLGLWEAAKRGIRVEPAFWTKVVQFFLDKQHNTGGWSYRAGENENPRATMTCAGLTALLVAQQELYRNQPRANAAIANSIERGMAYMNSGKGKGDSGYYWMGIERVALGLGYKYINGRDWFIAGAESFQKDFAKGMPKKGIVEPAFALMFLSRGRVPVWCTKLKVPGMAWNNRPNDIYFLSKALSDFREGEINWQVLEMDRRDVAEDLVTAPVAYLASDEAVKLTDEQVAQLKRYLDLGGMLVCNPENDSPYFAESVRALAKQMYPHLEMTRMPADHPLFSSLHRLDPGPSRGIEHLHNGVRDLIILANDDWGFTWQANPNVMQTRPGQLAVNLFVLAANRGVLPNRLDARFETRNSKQKIEARIAVARPIYPGGQANVEPLAWERISNRLVNRAGIEINPTPIADGDGNQAVMIEQLGASDAPLAHLTGVDAVTFNQTQLEAIRTFAQNGGTVLIETVGGQGEFARSLGEQLRPLFGRRPGLLVEEDLVVDAREVGGVNCGTVGFRRYTQFRMQLPDRPRLTAFFVDGRPAVILSNEDLSLGAMGVPRWGISGYEHDSAVDLMTNIALAARHYRSTAGRTAAAQ